MDIPDIISDRLSVTLDKLEEKRPGIMLRAIDESKAELDYTIVTTDREKLHVGLYTAIKLCRAALDLYQEDIAQEQADDVQRQYQDRIIFLKEKIAQLQQEFQAIDALLKGDPNATPPCFDIEKAPSDD